MKNTIFTLMLAACSAMFLQSCMYSSGQNVNQTTQTHTVVQGDNLHSIAAHYGVPVSKLREANPHLCDRSSQKEKTVFELIKETIQGPDTTKLANDTILVAKSSQRTLKKSKKSYEMFLLHPGEVVNIPSLAPVTTPAATAATTAVATMETQFSWADQLWWLLPLLVGLVFLALIALIFCLCKGRSSRSTSITENRTSTTADQDVLNEHDARITALESNVANNTRRIDNHLAEHEAHLASLRDKMDLGGEEVSMFGVLPIISRGDVTVTNSGDGKVFVN